MDDEVIATGYKGISGSNTRTIAAWIKTSSTGTIAYWGENATGKKSAFRIRSNNPNRGVIRYEIDGGYIHGSTVLNDNQWHHVCAVLPAGATDIDQTLLYVDGQLETIVTTSSRTINTGSLEDFKIGSDNSIYFEGVIDDVRLYSRALSAQEINDLPGFSNAIANPNELKTEYR